MAHAIIGNTRLRLTAAALGVLALALLLTYLGTSGARADSTQLARDPGGGVTVGNPAVGDDEGKAPDCNAPYAEVVSGGHIAMFDIYWDDDNKVLADNPCPPTVHFVPAGLDDEGRSTPARHERKASNIHIDETVIQIPNSVQRTLVNPSQDTTEIANPLEVPDDSELGEAGETIWFLEKSKETSADPPMVLGFTADHLEPVHWDTVGFKLVSIRVPDRNPNDRGRLLIYKDNPSLASSDPVWDSQDIEIDCSAINIEAGDDGHFYWAFTKPGTYVLQVNVEAQTDTEDAKSRFYETEADKKIKSVSSEVREYTIHVGPYHDLGVTLTDDDTLVEGNYHEGSYRLEAINNGPDAAENLVVQVQLPPGLEYDRWSSTIADRSFSHGCGAVAWHVGELPSGDSKTLEFGARGDVRKLCKKITLTAEIRDVVHDEPDPDSSNNTASLHYTNNQGANVDPLWWPYKGAVLEHSGSGAAVGDPVPAIDPDMHGLHYTLKGECENRFAVDSDGQITVSSTGSGILDYEHKWSYPLTLRVSDVDKSDDEVDATVGVVLHILNDSGETTIPRGDVALTYTPPDPIAGETDKLTATVSNAHDIAGDLTYAWYSGEESGCTSEVGWGEAIATATTAGLTNEYILDPSPVSTWKYEVRVSYQEANDTRHELGRAEYCVMRTQ